MYSVPFPSGSVNHPTNVSPAIIGLEGKVMVVPFAVVNCEFCSGSFCTTKFTVKIFCSYAGSTKVSAETTVPTGNSVSVP